jgi:hypothetical protein
LLAEEFIPHKRNPSIPEGGTLLQCQQLQSELKRKSRATVIEEQKIFWLNNILMMTILPAII